MGTQIRGVIGVKLLEELLADDAELDVLERLTQSTIARAWTLRTVLLMLASGVCFFHFPAEPPDLCAVNYTLNIVSCPCCLVGFALL